MVAKWRRCWKEKEYIIDTGVKNGFQPRIMQKKAKRQKIGALTSAVNKRRIRVTNSVSSKRKDGLNIEMVPSSRIHRLKSRVGSPKDGKFNQRNMSL